MNDLTLLENEFKKILLADTPLIDVRAPVEYESGSIPNAINLPILTNEERHEIGTIYKQEGKDQAIKRGHELVSGSVKKLRIQAWNDFIRLNPKSMLYCFRGGLRSKTAQQWLKDEGVLIQLVPGGYKALRRYLIETLQQQSQQKMVILSGITGCGKTEFIQTHQENLYSIDLESIAIHRGSSFGSRKQKQPAQAVFENKLAHALLKLSQRISKTPFLVEDESRIIGKCILPECFFARMKESPVVLIEESFEVRVEQIYKEYVMQSDFEAPEMYLAFAASLAQISKKLGHGRYLELSKDLKNAENFYLEAKDHSLNRIWIEKVINYYYDPIYLRLLEKKKDRIVFRGSKSEVLEFLIANF